MGHFIPPYHKKEKGTKRKNVASRKRKTLQRRMQEANRKLKATPDVVVEDVNRDPSSFEGGGLF